MPNIAAVPSSLVTIGDAGVRFKGPSLVSFQLDFTGAQSYDINLQVLQAQGVFGIPRSIYVNNRLNPNGITITIPATGSVEYVPANSIGLLPISSQAGGVITLQSTGGVAAGNPIEVELYNYERPPYVYGGLGQFQPGSQVEALAPNAVTLTPRNTTLAPGVAVNVFLSVAQTRQLRFRNVGDGAGGGDDAYWNVNATATGSFAAGDRLLQVSESLLLPYRTASRISFFSTNGTRIEGEEWTS